MSAIIKTGVKGAKALKKAYKGRKRGRKPKAKTQAKTAAARQRRVAKRGETAATTTPKAETTPKRVMNLTGSDRASRFLSRRRTQKAAQRERMAKERAAQPGAKEVTQKLPAKSAKAPAPKGKLSLFSFDKPLTKAQKAQVKEFVDNLTPAQRRSLQERSGGDFRKLPGVSKLLTGDEAAGMARTAGVTKTGKTVRKIFPGPLTHDQVMSKMGYLKERVNNLADRVDAPKRTREQAVARLEKLFRSGYGMTTKGKIQKPKKAESDFYSPAEAKQIVGKEIKAILDNIKKNASKGKITQSEAKRARKRVKRSATKEVARKTGQMKPTSKLNPNYKMGTTTAKKKGRRVGTPRGCGSAKRGYGKAMKG